MYLSLLIRGGLEDQNLDINATKEKSKLCINIATKIECIYNKLFMIGTWYENKGDCKSS